MDVQAAQVVFRGNGGHIPGDLLVPGGLGDLRRLGRDDRQCAHADGQQRLRGCRTGELRTESAQSVQRLGAVLAHIRGELYLAGQPFVLDISLGGQGMQSLKPAAGRYRRHPRFLIEQDKFFFNPKSSHPGVHPASVACCVCASLPAMPSDEGAMTLSGYARGRKYLG